MSVVEVDAGATSTASVQVTLLAVGTPDEISFSWLSQDERERAARYTRPEAGRSFMIRRALLRRTLALALDANPADIRFEVDEMGKPHLASHPDHEFSFSHAGAFALIALGRLRLGVDIESLDNILDQPTLATRVLTRRELAIYDAQSPEARPRMLLQALVRKEALVKAMGMGLRRDPTTFDVWGDDETDLPLLVHPDTGTEWTCSPIAAPHGYAAALAVEGTRIDLRVDEAGTNLSASIGVMDGPWGSWFR